MSQHQLSIACDPEPSDIDSTRQRITMEQQKLTHQSPKAIWISKLTLRILSAIFDIVLIGVSSAMGTDWTEPPIIYFLPPACLSLAWGLADGIFILARAGRRGIHPGACIGADLVLWLGFAAASVMYIIFGYGWYFDSPRWFEFFDDSTDFYTLNRACVVIGFVEMVMHIVLFIIACYETSVRNRPVAVFYQGPPPGMAPSPGSNTVCRQSQTTQRNDAQGL
jgi:hypothetical protein